MGVNIVVIDAATQFIIVANGTIFAGIISGTYSLIGGRNNPKTKKKEIMRINTIIPAGGQSGNMKSIPRSKLMIVKSTFPVRMRGFLPYFAIIIIVKMFPNSWAPVTIKPV